MWGALPCDSKGHGERRKKLRSFSLACGSCNVLFRTMWRLRGRAPLANLDEDEVVEDVAKEGAVEAEGARLPLQSGHRRRS